MDPFVCGLRDLCRAHPTRAKWVFVPSHAVGRTLGDRLARDGVNWGNLRFVRPIDVALEMGAPFLVERGIDPSDEGLGPALAMRLLLALPEDGGYFRPLAGQPQLAVALWATLRELRMAGVRATGLPVGTFASADKARELVALLGAYEEFLREHSRGDSATVFEEAVRHLDWCPIKPQDCWTDLPDVRWTPLERQLIDAMPGERISSRSPAPESARANQAGGPASRAFFHAGGHEAEIEEVFRRILQSGVPLDNVEIACPGSQYSTLIWEKAIRYEWPVTVERGLPLSVTRPGRALLAFIEWIEDDFAAGRLRRLLQSGDVRLPAGTGLSSAQAARLLVKAQAAWGRRTFRLSCARLAASSRRRAEREDISEDQRTQLIERAGEAEALATWIDGIIMMVPEPNAAGMVALRDVAESARAFIETSAARTTALDRLAAASLVEAIGELGALDTFSCPIDQALRFLRERVDGLVVGADRPRPGHMHVSALQTAGYAGRSSVFVVGLEEGRVFPTPFEDPVLLDRERLAIGHDLQTSRERIGDAVRAVQRRLAVIASESGTSLTFSYSCRDLREYRQTYASWAMLEAWRSATGNPAATYQQLQKALGAPKSCVPSTPDAALDASRWWLHGAVRAGDSARSAVLSQYPSLAAGEVARAARASADFTAYDGWVPAAGPVLDPCNVSGGVSPTQLEDAASCPFRHFLRRGLGVEAIESGERDRDVWLDPLLRGTLLHDLYAALLRRCREEKRRVTVADDAEWLLMRGRETLATLALEMPPPSVEVSERESRLFSDDLKLFLDAEAALDPSRKPVGFEVGFGRAASEEDCEPLAQADPVIIDLGQGLRIRLAGRIDRVDEVGPATFEIVDYKTGGYWPDDWKGIFAGGTRLQHALYGLAATELLRRTVTTPKVSGAQYYFSSVKGQQERKHIPAQPMGRVGEVLADLRRVIVNGLFIHATDERACQWCDYGHACGATAAERAETKLADARLAPFLKLSAHE